MRESKSSIISHGDIGKRMPNRNVTQPKIAGGASSKKGVSESRFSLAGAGAIASAPVKVRFVNKKGKSFSH